MDSTTLEETKHSASIQTPQPTVKHGGGGRVIWACFAATGPEHLEVTESTVNSSAHQKCFRVKSEATVWELNSGSNWMQQVPSLAANLQQNRMDVAMVQ